MPHNKERDYMSFNLADLRKARNADFSEITAALKKTADGGNFKNDDEDFFKLERDKAGNGSAVIRFLPKHPDDALPWVAIYSHGFQGPSGRWYIENSLTTLDQPDPVAEANRALWSTGNEKDKEQARKQKRKLNYIANIRIISYPAHPEMEGQVKRFKFGKKIFEKLMDKANPTFDDEKPINPFDPFDGCDFKLRMRQVDGYPNYDTSVFAEPAPIASSDEAIMDILNQVKPLKEFLDPGNFKSYDELLKKFNSVMNASPASTSKAEETVERMAKEPSAPPKSVGKSVKESTSGNEPEDSDDIEQYFKDLAV